MSRRTELQTIFEELLGSRNVYFQPPEDLKMQYDCIRYSRDKIETDFADNSPYNLHDRYQVIAIYKNPDSDLPHKIAMLPMCSHDRSYTSNNLNHDVFTLYY
jgi:hypothetical protein